jgi:hypothetical protein
MTMFCELSLKAIFKSSPTHDALSVPDFLAKKSITKMDHPPYSPDLAPSDFYLFPKLEKFPEGVKVC